MSNENTNLSDNKPDNITQTDTPHERGKLKIFLGYAPGVGKTYTMLMEANRLRERGRDVVIGYFEPHGRSETVEQIGSLPCIPYLEIWHNGSCFHEINTEEIIRRNPQLVLIDELAHTNTEGMKHKKRYQDVLELLEHGINVYSTVNLQHLDSMNRLVEHITGIHVNETLPDHILEEADEVVIVDIQPRSLQNRLKRGVIYDNGSEDSALHNFFRLGNLNALRELALRKVADHIDVDLEEYKQLHHINSFWHTTERILVAIKASEESQHLIREAARLNSRLKGDFYVVYVDCTHWLAPKQTEVTEKVLGKNFELAKSLGAECLTLHGKSVSDELIKFSTQKEITKILIGHTKRPFLARVFRGSTINKILKSSDEIQILVTPNQYF